MNKLNKSNKLQDVNPWFTKGLTIKHSNIHGLGVFTKRLIKKGEIVFRLGGSLLPIEFRKTKKVIPSTTTAIAESIILTELKDSEKDFSDYLNHSCNPNMGFIDAITLVATRNIKSAEEVTLDYAYCEADELWELKHDCECMFKSCRKKVTGLDWRILELHDRFLLWASPFIRRRISRIKNKN